jgi:serine/threonine protein kinase
VIVTTKNQINITLSQKPLGSGGEGGVFKIISPQHYLNKCVKIYNGFEKPNTTNRNTIQNKEGKIKFMVDNPPTKINEGVWMLTWPEELVYDSKGNFLGYVMSLANPNEQNEQLFNLLGHELHPSIKSNANKYAIWGKFSENNIDFIKNRLMVCSNIAKAFHFLHITNNYVVVDLKPENILVSEKGKIAVCDLDSIQISNNNKVLYHADVATPNTAPPENKDLMPVSKSLITVEWDRFSMATVFYELIFGVNPFGGMYFRYPYDNIGSTVQLKIEKGLFINGELAKNHLTNESKQGEIYLKHCLFNKIDNKIQQLFLKALDDGCFNPKSRPNAEQWGIAFSNYVHVLQQNPIDFRNYLIVPKSSTNSTQATNTYKPSTTATQKTVTTYTPTPTIQQPQIPPYTQKSSFDSRYILLVGGLLFIFFILFVTKYKKQTVEPATEYTTEVTTEVATEAVSTNNYTPTTTETTVQPPTETENNTNTTSTYYENDYYLNKIKNFYIYEKNRDFNALYNNYLQNLNRYYDLNTPTYSSLEKRFNHLWEITSDVSNNLKSYELNRFDNHVQLIITLDYTYFGIKTQEYKTINDIKVVFNFDNNGNMMGIYDMK